MAKAKKNNEEVVDATNVETTETPEVVTPALSDEEVNAMVQDEIDNPGGTVIEDEPFQWDERSTPPPTDQQINEKV